MSGTARTVTIHQTKPGYPNTYRTAPHVVPRQPEPQFTLYRHTRALSSQTTILWYSLTSSSSSFPWSQRKDSIAARMEAVFRNGSPRISELVFPNALTRTDYDESEWREVAAVRARSNWEAPVSELTGAITGDGGLQFVDARVAAREAPGPRSTCRFNTRIDYVFLGPGTASRWRVAACEHVEAIPAASDHNLVVATLETA